MESEPTAELIRAQLRRLRLAANLTQEDFGKQVHFSGSQISAIELGQRPFDRLFLKRADEVLNSDGLLLGLLRIAELHGQPHFLRPWLDAERVATQLRCYHPTLVPGLLQTEHYARAVIRSDDMLTDDEVERRVAVRMDRQAILTRPDPPILIAVIEETALRRVDESFRGIMTQQIGHLLDCVKRGGVLIHVISADVSVHVGHAGPLTLARGADGDWVGYLENQVGGATIDRAEELATLHAVWEGIRSVALPKGQSELLMKEVMESWSTI
ncbi:MULTISPECIES: helix-turn-helix transcriptional regulator [unclassified Micromonospora]|uniref:helix-turn-helix domain-containing protein n=1 Tax=unclassified Micromonospora TaxID=2617518 RepID=UPI0022B649D2|nr:MULTISPECIES: helix-turn-helix transcriptional regulator [unclassified Micromonospora]MCZ7421726.1 helix-turn-helix transcriptional regulator [Verrucosispora sp. WMMA2121]WBB93600.1 helix-turn-helix transcriptional regulator [Verrucosispora sp. WMMC514]